MKIIKALGGLLFCVLLLGAGQSADIGNAVEAEATAVLQEAESAVETIEGDSDEDSNAEVTADNETETEEEMQLHLLTRLGLGLAIAAGQAFLIWLVWLLFKKLGNKIVTEWTPKIKPLTIKKLRILNTNQIINSSLFLLRIVKYIVTAFQLFITVPLIFLLFPETEDIAKTLFGYILTPLKNILFGVIDYIPKLITVVIILFVTRYVLRGLKFFTTQIEKERLVLPGFYADWAKPTYNILSVLLYAFTLALIYPYLPGSDSQAFQGVSVFIGILFSLGSSSAISNLIAGFVITYMRPFKLGDRIQIQQNTGFVVEKSLFVTRIKTHKNEYVTFPNVSVLSASIINYNTSTSEGEEGLVLYSEVTFGYHTPWPLVHEILIGAAQKTAYVEKQPKPFVLQTALDDFYCRYQINCFTKSVRNIPAIYSELYQHIQDGFKAAGLDMTAPAYRIHLPADSGVEVTADSENTGK
ncbi:mechanosensitive ion channel family protein [Breznakiellaceae bacterium SP9]